MTIETTAPELAVENAAPAQPKALRANPRPSIDPTVAQVHALREQQWQIYGEDTRAWFEALLLSQSAAKRKSTPL